MREKDSSAVWTTLASFRHLRALPGQLSSSGLLSEDF